MNGRLLKYFLAYVLNAGALAGAANVVDPMIATDAQTPRQEGCLPHQCGTDSFARPVTMDEACQLLGAPSRGSDPSKGNNIHCKRIP